MTGSGHPILAFDAFEIDRARGELRRGGTVVPVEPQVFDLIAHLALHPGEILSRDELIEAVWGGRIVSDSAISSRMNAARAALGDDGATQRFIRTVPRRGFRFEAEISTPSRRAAPKVPDRPSIAVLPFQNLSEDPGQSYFADGITDDIITDLSRYDDLFVIARQSAFAYRDSTKPPAEIARELGVQYLANGSVRRAGNRVRISVQLVDPAAGVQLWAERYDRNLTDIFEVQDEIAAVIVNMLVGEIARQHYKRVQGKRPEAIDAYDHTVRATEHALRIAPEDNRLARDEALAAIATDPDFARGHAVLSLTCITEGNNLWTADPERSFRRAHEAAAAAIAADPRDPWAHAMLGISELWHHRAHGRALTAMEKSVSLNPSNAYFRGLYAYVLPFAGDAARALDEIELAIRMNPLFPAVFHGFRGRALLILRRIDEALPCLQQMVTLMPGHSNALGYVAVAYAAAGRPREARAAIAEVCASNPHYRLGALRRVLPFRKPEDREFMLALLEEAGLPE